VGYQLLLKGRLSLHDLVRFTQFPQKQVRECLVVMIQHGLCYFSEAVEGKMEPTFFTADPIRITMRVRSGAIMRHVEERYGKEVKTCFFFFFFFLCTHD
jgi:DNA-directed RNA polymerase III subunit RPC3